MTKASARDAPAQAAMSSSQYHVCFSVRAMLALIDVMFCSIVFFFIRYIYVCVCVCVCLPPLPIGCISVYVATMTLGHVSLLVVG